MQALGSRIANRASGPGPVHGRVRGVRSASQAQTPPTRRRTARIPPQPGRTERHSHDRTSPAAQGGRAVSRLANVGYSVRSAGLDRRGRGREVEPGPPGLPGLPGSVRVEGVVLVESGMLSHGEGATYPRARAHALQPTWRIRPPPAVSYTTRPGGSFVWALDSGHLRITTITQQKHNGLGVPSGPAYYCGVLVSPRRPPSGSSTGTADRRRIARTPDALTCMYRG